jgi:lysophospholipase L1-like esterase
VQFKRIINWLAYLFSFLFFLVLVREDYPSKIYHRFWNNETQANDTKIIEDVASSSYPKDWNEYYYQRQSLFNQLTTHDKVVFLGNSITDNGEWRELFSDDLIVNRGIGGDFVPGILSRLDNIIEEKPRCIFLMIGINDIRWRIPLEKVRTTYDSVINRITVNDIPLYIQSTLYVGKWHDRIDIINRQVDSLNYHLKELSNQRDFEFIDVNAVLSEDGYMKPDYTNDNLHLLGTGYLKWIEQIRPFVDNCLQNSEGL